MSTPGNLQALIKYHVVAGISTVRWRFVPPVYVLMLISFIVDNQRIGWWNEIPIGSDANVWDVGLYFLCDVFHDCIVLLLGFMLLVGDDLARGHTEGTLRSTMLLSHSRLRWWSAKILAMGVLAFAYVGIVQASTMLASLIMGIPFSLHNSVASVRIQELQVPWYELPSNWSTMGYNLFALFSLAFTTWVVTVVHQTMALFVFPNNRIPFVVFFGWLILGFVVQASGQWWDLRFLMYPGKVFDNFGRGSTTIPVFFGVMTFALLGAATVGYRRLQRMDF